MLVIPDNVVESHKNYELENNKFPGFIRDRRIFKRDFRMIENGFGRYTKISKYKVKVDINLVNYIVLTDAQ